ncbi:MAG TPA: peptidylprolyl isomerase [Dongiaceae bacterium]|jgi:peptidyl-prolyl cis-trans isomerase B (cyclophilin B)|nr:peptidylprolyl isomerase [Dongiaceae bacterium]
MMQQNGARSRAVWLVAAFGLAFGVAPVAALAKPQLTRDRLDLAAADPEGHAPGHNPKVSMSVAVDGEDGRRTDLGTIVIELFPQDAPKHVENFLKLAKDGFYTGLTFHRIVPAFVIQGGDPLSRGNWQSNRLGTGGPGYNIPAEIVRKHMRGAVAAARKNDPVLNPSKESSGSQFYICLADLPSLDQAGYTVFGQVDNASMEVVDKIARVKNTGPQQNQALQRVIITKVSVED